MKKCDAGADNAYSVSSSHHCSTEYYTSRFAFRGVLRTTVDVVVGGGLLFLLSFIFIFSGLPVFASFGATFDSTDCGVVFGVITVGVDDACDDGGPDGVEPPGVNGGGGESTLDPGV